MLLLVISLVLGVIAAILAVRLAYLMRHRTGLREVNPVPETRALVEGAVTRSAGLGATNLAQPALVEMGARFTLFTDQAAEVFWSTQLDARRVVYGPAFERIWGRPNAPDGDSGLWLEAIHPAELEMVFRSWNRLLESKGAEPYDVEYRIRRPDGSFRWIHDRAVPLHDGAGEATQICGVAGDITDRKRADAQLRMVIQDSPEAIVLVDDSGAILMASAKVASIFGYGRGDLIGRPVVRLIPGGLHGNTDSAGLHANGTLVSLEVRVTRMETGEGTLSLAFLTDTSERKKLDLEREDLQDRLVESQRLESLGVLAGGVAHDFNNLLTLVLCNAQLARSEAAPGSTVAAALLHIEQATYRASELTRQMLAYAGRGQLVIGPVDLSALVGESAALLKAALPGAALLEIALEDSLPAIEADPGQVRQILVGLVTNAGEALDNGHGTVTVRTGCVVADRSYLDSTVLGAETAEGPYTFLEVADDGSGMSEVLQQQMFEPFFSTRASGRGLGLAAVLGILRRHRGTIRVESQPGRGTSIRILLPLAGRPEQRKLEPEASGEGLVLLVDDELEVLRLISKFLRRAGFEVLSAASGEEALACFRTRANAIDTIVLDLTMPGMGGDELLRAIRTIDRNVSVIVTSGYTEDEVTRRCAGLSITAFLPKPYLPAELTAEVRRAITADRLRRAGSPAPK